jgi:hypothetical protein
MIAMTTVKSILDKTSDSNPDEHIDASGELKELCDGISSDADSLSSAVVAGVWFASHENKKVSLRGSKALSYIVKPDAVVRKLANQSFDDAAVDVSLTTLAIDLDAIETYLDLIVEASIEKLSPDAPPKVRSRSTLTVARIASARPARVSTDKVFDHLASILETETKRLRIQRAISVLTKLGSYECPRKEEARRRLADHVAQIRDPLLQSEKKTSQRIGMKAVGVASLLFPDRILQVKELQEIIENPTARPRLRNRAIRSLWQLGRTYPGVAVTVQPTLVKLLSSSVDGAEKPDNDSNDTADPEKYAKFIPSNAAKTFATIARTHPESVDPTVIPIFVDLIKSRDTAIHRAILAIGELATTYPQELHNANAAEILQSYLKAEKASQSTTKQHTKARGYAVWALLKLAGDQQPQLPIEPAECIEFLLAVPGTEKTQFDHRRTDALRGLAAHSPTILEDEAVTDYLLSRLTTSANSTERYDAAHTLLIGSQSESLSSIVSVATILDVLESEIEVSTIAVLIGLLSTLDADLSSDIEPVIETKEESIRRVWNHETWWYSRQLVCCNCGGTFSFDITTKGALCEGCEEGYLSEHGESIQFTQ